MSERLPKHIEPLRLARNGTELFGAVPLTELPRLREVLLSDAGDAEVALKFGLDSRGFVTISGHVSARVVMQCQRCLEAMTVDVMSEVAVGVVRNSAQEKLLPAELEPMPLGADEELVLNDMVEDELILALPIVARHPEDQACAARGGRKREVDEVAERPNPFAVLASLKKNH